MMSSINIAFAAVAGDDAGAFARAAQQQWLDQQVQDVANICVNGIPFHDPSGWIRSAGELGMSETQSNRIPPPSCLLTHGESSLLVRVPNVYVRYAYEYSKRRYSYGTVYAGAGRESQTTARRIKPSSLRGPLPVPYCSSSLFPAPP